MNKPVARDLKKDTMETLIVKVDTKRSMAFLRKLLLNFNFVIEVKSAPSDNLIIESDRVNIAGRLHRYADVNKIIDEKMAWQKVVEEKHGAH
jgi:hypothetical protein